MKYGAYMRVAEFGFQIPICESLAADYSHQLLNPTCESLAAGPTHLLMIPTQAAHKGNLQHLLLGLTLEVLTAGRTHLHLVEHAALGFQSSIRETPAVDQAHPDAFTHGQSVILAQASPLQNHLLTLLWLPTLPPPHAIFAAKCTATALFTRPFLQVCKLRN
jgi:hypothetical protein